MEDEVCGWTIYRHPPEYPRHYAVRQWWVTDTGLLDSPIAALCDDLDEARTQIPVGTICFPRDETDDPMVVETWI